MELNLVIVSHRDSKNKELNEDLRLIIVAPHNQVGKKATRPSESNFKCQHCRVLLRNIKYSRW